MAIDTLHAQIEQDEEALQSKFEEIVKDQKEKTFKEMSRMIDDIVTDFMPYVASDLYQNILQGYSNWLCGDYSRIKSDFGSGTAKDFRAKVLKENYDSIVKDLNQDNLETIDELRRLLENERVIRSLF